MILVMAYDRGLEQRLYEYFQDRPDLTVKKMFGGLCFLLSGHMCCGIMGERLMARIGPKNYDYCLLKPHASKMDFTGTPIKTMVYVEPLGLESDFDLASWLDLCVSFVDILPPKNKYQLQY